MLMERYAETVSFSCVSERCTVRSRVAQLVDKRFKETLLVPTAMVPSSFASTIVCPQASNYTRKHFKDLTRIEPRNKPRHFSVTCYLTPPRKNFSFETEVVGGKLRVNNHFINCVKMAGRGKLEKVNGVKMVTDTQASSSFITSPRTTKTKSSENSLKN